MGKRLIIPKPLFDTLENLTEGIPLCVPTYIKDTVLNKIKPQSINAIEKEIDLTREFLLSYGGSADTYNAYRREIERLLHWSWLIQKKPIKELNRNDIRDYLEFSNNPPLTWITTKNISRFINCAEGYRTHNPKWRPYVTRPTKAQRLAGKLPKKEKHQLSNNSIQALFSILSTYFTYLQQEDYLSINPVSLIRQKKRYIQRQQTKKITRKLSHTQWNYVIDAAEQMANQNPKHERILFLMSAFYLLGLRISELAETPGRIPCMSDFAPDKNDMWWFTTVGKGNKIRDVAIPDTMLNILKRYRKSLDLSPLPTRSEQTPLIQKQRGKGGLGTRQIRNLVQSCFNRAIVKLQKANKKDEAIDLATATVHWLRHTSISFSIEENRPREDIRDDVGHESAATMDKYIDTDRITRHHSAKNKKLKPQST